MRPGCPEGPRLSHPDCSLDPIKIWWCGQLLRLQSLLGWAGGGSAVRIALQAKLYSGPRQSGRVVVGGVTLQIGIDNSPILRRLRPPTQILQIFPVCQRAAQLANQLLQPLRAKIACQTRVRERDRAGLGRPAHVCNSALHFHESFRPVYAMHDINDLLYT